MGSDRQHDEIILCPRMTTPIQEDRFFALFLSSGVRQSLTCESFVSLS
jgi:hypothetical protein